MLLFIFLNFIKMVLFPSHMTKLPATDCNEKLHLFLLLPNDYTTIDFVFSASSFLNQIKWKCKWRHQLDSRHFFSSIIPAANQIKVDISGFASALSGRVAEALKGFFVSGDSLLVSLDADHDTAFDSFSAVPSKKQEALALLKLLKKFSWKFVSVVISDQARIWNFYKISEWGK